MFTYAYSTNMRFDYFLEILVQKKKGLFNVFFFVCRDVYALCVAHPEPMADRLYQETKKYLIDHVSSLLQMVLKDEEEHLIKNYYHYWSHYSVGSQYLHSLYLYLNQQHIRTHKLSDAEIIYGSSDSSGGKYMNTCTKNT